MSLFEVKGWDVPLQAAVTASPSHSSKKRKRPQNDPDKVQSAQVNVQKLMRKVEFAREQGTPGGFESQNEKRKKKNKQRSDDVRSAGRLDNQETRSRVKSQKRRKDRKDDVQLVPTKLKELSEQPPSKRPRKKAPGALSPGRLQPSTDDASSPNPRKTANKTPTPLVGLTSLQATMKDSLDGARFRWINEVLYTTSSVEGHKLMQDDPNLYEEYHAGFRQQVRSWPSNPINHYISVLSSYPTGTIIADLGCGDAALARTLVPRGYCVLSFDLVSDGSYVLEADVCKRIPLPGAEDSDDDNQNWIRCIRETWRVLRLGGELKIAEVASRFTDLDQFIAIISDLGFKLKSKDDSNTHFTLFDFRKIIRPPLSTKKWDSLQAKYEVLKPCEYKRR